VLHHLEEVKKERTSKPVFFSLDVLKRGLRGGGSDYNKTKRENKNNGRVTPI
jgi:hypothetical protein